MNHSVVLFIFLFFFLDVTLIGFFNCQYINLLTLLYSFELFFSHNSLSFLIALMMPLLLEEFIIDGRFGIHLLYLIPLTLIITHLRPYFSQESSILPCISVLLFLISKTAFRSGTLVPNSYIFFEICGNMILLLIYLKYRVKGRLDNRLYA